MQGFANFFESRLACGEAAAHSLGTSGLMYMLGSKNGNSHWAKKTSTTRRGFFKTCTTLYSCNGTYKKSQNALWLTQKDHKTKIRVVALMIVDPYALWLLRKATTRISYCGFYELATTRSGYSYKCHNTNNEF